MFPTCSPSPSIPFLQISSLTTGSYRFIPPSATPTGIFPPSTIPLLFTFSPYLFLLQTTSTPSIHYYKRICPPSAPPTDTFSFFRYPYTVFFGLQYILKRWLCGPVLTREMVTEAKQVIDQVFKRDDVFNEEGWNHIVEVSVREWRDRGRGWKSKGGGVCVSERWNDIRVRERRREG